MNPQDKQAIESVFTRLAQVEGTAGPRDSEAEAYIQSRLAAQPGAAYYLAQTVLIQQQALEEAQKRLSAQERSAAPAQAPAQPQSSTSGGGFFGFGRSSSQGSNRQNAPSQAAPVSSSGFGRSAPSAGGGFLAGAAQTALGVAGGMMLGSLLGGMFGSNDAHAAPAAEEPPADDAAAPEDEAGFDDAGFDDGGDFGGEDI